MHWHPQRLVHPRDRWQNKSGNAGAENDRRHHDVQPVEAAGGEEMRYGLRATFDQHAPQATGGQGLEDCRRREEAACFGQDDRLDVLPGRGVNFRDPWGNRVELVDYRAIQLTKASAVLNGMGLGGLEKSEAALEQLREKGLGGRQE